MIPEDAEQIAFMGLLRAAKFRPELGYQFSTYANHWIKQACWRDGPDFALMIRVPVHLFWPCYGLRLTRTAWRLKSGRLGSGEHLTELDARDPRSGRQLRELEPRIGSLLLLCLTAPNRNTEPHRRSPKPGPARWTPWNRQCSATCSESRFPAAHQTGPNHSTKVRLRWLSRANPGRVGNLLGLTRERVRHIESRAEGGFATSCAEN